MRKEIHARLRALADPEKARVLARFFKSGPGEYGEGDRFLGVTVPPLRRLARELRTAPREEVAALLASPWHEERLLALFILVDQFERASESEQQGIYEFYLAATARINNWDLVDASAEEIVGGWLFARDRVPLYLLAASPLLWERRIAVLATFHFIKRNDFADTLKLAEQLLTDREPLMHKAVGWMLREVGKRDLQLLRRFLARHAAQMPRTMLRYAVERLAEPERKSWLAAGRS